MANTRYAKLIDHLYDLVAYRPETADTKHITAGVAQGEDQRYEAQSSVAATNSAALRLMRQPGMERVIPKEIFAIAPHGAPQPLVRSQDGVAFAVNYEPGQDGHDLMALSQQRMSKLGSAGAVLIDTNRLATAIQEHRTGDESHYSRILIEIQSQIRIREGVAPQKKLGF